MLYLKKRGGGIIKRIALTLPEIIIVIVILGILYSLSLPNFSKMAEKNKGEKANFNLIAIYNAEKRYKLDQGQYYSCGKPCAASDINNNLSITVNDPNFDYGIIGNATHFEASAIRKKSQTCSGKEMTLTNDNSTIAKGCNLW